MRKSGRLLTCMLAAVACGMISGCGSSTDLDTVAISGKITCNGEPLSAGYGVNFIPQPPEGATGEDKTTVGKMATAILGEGGTFTLSTYGEGDGAVIGRHRILVIAPSGGGGGEDPDPEAGGPTDNDEEEGEGEEKEVEWPLACPPPAELYVDITASNSVVNIELGDGGKATAE